MNGDVSRIRQSYIPMNGDVSRIRQSYIFGAISVSRP
jgi:hypothetical protein